MLNIKKLSLLIAAFSIAVPAFAQDMRCGNNLIQGDQIQPLLKEQVLEMCGEPTEKDYDRWFYQDQHKILVFNGNDELDHIEDTAIPE